MKIRLYQINPEKDTKQAMFMPYGMIDSVNSEIYDLVYESDLSCSSLEEVYVKLNIDHPSDYRCRSMFVSDVLEVRESDTVPQGFYFCDMLGFKQIDFNSEEDDSSADTDPTSEHQAKISVLLVEPGKYPQMIEIDNSLEAMQELVGGYIEVIMPYESQVALVCNEEGRLTNLPLNRALYLGLGEGRNREVSDIIHGSFFICYASDESGEFLSLPKELAEKYKTLFRLPELFFKQGDRIKVVPYEP